MPVVTELSHGMENFNTINTPTRSRKRPSESEDSTPIEKTTLSHRPWSSASILSPSRPEKRPRVDSPHRPTANTAETPRSTRSSTLVNQRKAAEAAKLGNTLLNCRQYKNALKQFSAALKLCPTFPSYYTRRCQCYMTMGLFGKALADARRSTEVDTKFVTGYKRQAECLLGLGRPEEAVEVLTVASGLNTEDREVTKALKSAKELSKLQTLAERDLQTGANDSVVVHVDKLIDSAPLCTKYKLMKAEIFIQQKNYADARAIVEEVLKVDETADALYIHGLCLHYSGDEQGSYSKFDKALKSEPRHARTLAFLETSCQLAARKEEGNVAFKAGEYQKAYDLYTEALTIDPQNKLTNAKLYNNRAAVCVKLGRLNNAIRDCTQAIELDPAYVKAISRRATCYMDTECYEEAIRDFQTLCEINPTPENKKLLREAQQKQKLSMQTDFYKILGVEQFATADDIKKAYRKLALKCHPDKHAGASDDEKIAMEKKFKAIGEAHQILSDPVERAQYDRELRLENLRNFMSDDEQTHVNVNVNINVNLNVNVNGKTRTSPYKSRFTFHYV